jgi:hypothetical protein
LLIVVGLAALSGCSWTSSLWPFGGAKEPAATAAAAACPTATILRPLAQTAVFAPDAVEHNPTEVAFYGILDDVTATCARQGDAVRVSLDVVVIGQRGPAARSWGAVDLQYFVAVTGPNDTILSKRSLPVRIALPVDRKRAGVTDHIEEMVPLAGLTPGQLTIDLGFQQPPAVVDYYRHFRGR